MRRVNFHSFIGGRRSGDAAADPESARRAEGLSDEVYLDALDLSGAVLGPGVVLNQCSSGGYVLYVVAECRARPIGWFETAAEAWEAVDALDDPRRESAGVGTSRRC